MYGGCPKDDKQYSSLIWFNILVKLAMAMATFFLGRLRPERLT